MSEQNTADILRQIEMAGNDVMVTPADYRAMQAHITTLESENERLREERLAFATHAAELEAERERLRAALRELSVLCPPGADNQPGHLIYVNSDWIANTTVPAGWFSNLLSPLTQPMSTPLP